MLSKLFFLILVSTLLALNSFSEEKRLALIIANEDYPSSVGRLTNTHQDAALVAGALEETGFAVTLILDANEDEMDSALSSFERNINTEAEDGDEVIAFFYASMHGATTEVNGRTRNFLLPAKENIDSPGELVRTGIRMDELLQGLALTDASAVLVISDACRNNLATSFTKAISDKGFVPEPTGQGMLVAYATSPGSTTPDDGLFAKILSEEIVKPGRRATIAIVDAVDRISSLRDFDGQPYFNPGGLPDWLCFADCNTQEGVFTLQQVARDALENGFDANEKELFGESLSWFTQACLGNIASGCFELGVQYEEGLGVERNYPQARSFFSLACDRGDQKGCYRAALYHDLDDTERTALLRGACYGDIADACENLGIQFEQGKGVDQSDIEAENYYRRSCELGSASGCSQLGQFVGAGNLQAFELFKTGCEGGSVDGCAMLAGVYEVGNGVEQDSEKTKFYYSKACDIPASYNSYDRPDRIYDHEKQLYVDIKLDGNACTWLGQYFAAEEFGEQDYSLAHSYFLAGCEEKSPGSCHGLGVLWEADHRDPEKEKNEALQSDARMAFGYYSQACGLGYDESCDKIQSSCEERNGIACTALSRRFYGSSEDGSQFESSDLLEKACDYGDGLGCAYLGQRIEAGDGVRADPIRALEIMERGCELGAPRACELFKGREFSIDIHRKDCVAGDRTACIWLDNSGYPRE